MSRHGKRTHARDAAEARVGWDLANDFLRGPSGLYRTPSNPHAHVPFTRSALESGAVLADFLLERGERLAGLHVQSFLSNLVNEDGSLTTVEMDRYFQNMYGRMLRALQRIELRKKDELSRPEKKEVKKERWTLEVDKTGRRLIWITDEKTWRTQSAIVYPDGRVAYDWIPPAYIHRRVQSLARKSFENEPW